MRILYDNQVEDATLTFDTEDTNYPASDVLNIATLRTWRSTDLDSFLVFELDAGVQFDSIAILNHNFTSSATITLEANATDSWGSPSFTHTITYKDGIIFEDFDSSGVSIANLVFWRLRIQDATNTDGYISIGYVSLGVYLDMPGMTPTQGLFFNTNSIVEFSTSNNVFGDPRPNYRRESVEFPIVENTDRTDIKNMFINNGNYRPMIIAPWEDDVDFEDNMYCVINQDELAFKKVRDATFSVVIEFREVE